MLGHGLKLTYWRGKLFLRFDAIIEKCYFEKILKLQAIVKKKVDILEYYMITQYCVSKFAIIAKTVRRKN